MYNFYCRLFLGIAIFLCSGFGQNKIAAQVKFVKIGGTGLGSSWDDALGETSLEATIEAGDTIYIAAGSYSPTGNINLEIDVPTLIQGGFPASAVGNDLSGYDPITNQTIIEGDANRHIFHYTGLVSEFEIKGLVLQNSSSFSGPAFYKKMETLTETDFKFTDLLVQDNFSSIYGAIDIRHVKNANSKIVFSNCYFMNNEAGNGGALVLQYIYNDADETAPNLGNFVIDNCSFENNIGDSNGGGAIWMHRAQSWSIQNTTFCDNLATPTAQGGAIRVSNGGNFVIDSCSFLNNYASDGAGALNIGQSVATILNSTFVENTCDTTANGGAIRSYISSTLIDNCVFYNNTAGSGGAIRSHTWKNNITSTANNCIFSGNKALRTGTSTTSGGGAISISIENNAWDIDNSVFTYNTVRPESFGGAINVYDSDIGLTNNIFYNNTRGDNALLPGSDVMNFDGSGGYHPMSGNKMQLPTSSDYTDQISPPTATSYEFTDDTFLNLSDGGVTDSLTATCSGITFVYGSAAANKDVNITPYESSLVGDVSLNDIDWNVPTHYSLVTANGGMSTLDGTVSIDQYLGTYNFTPTAGYVGTTSFSYQICDSTNTAYCDTSTVYIEVLQKVDVDALEIIANPDIIMLASGKTGMGNVLANDVDPNKRAINISTILNNETVSGIDKAGNFVSDAGTLSLDVFGNFTFVPTGAFTGEVTKNYVLSTAATPGNSDTTFINLIIEDVEGNDTRAVNDFAVGDLGETIKGNVLTNDFDLELDSQAVMTFSIDTDGNGKTDASRAIGISTSANGPAAPGTLVSHAGMVT